MLEFPQKTGSVSLYNIKDGQFAEFESEMGRKDSSKKCIQITNVAFRQNFRALMDANSLLKRTGSRCNTFSGTISKGLDVIKKRLVGKWFFVPRHQKMLSLPILGEA
ncbi:MAG: hypothetical protein RBS73_16815 [Prolixibacteraceae bacterium]|jgi:hypothetical protein|nr:hypothetical protein [Prolixibacteraceae bacterium]